MTETARLQQALRRFAPAGLDPHRQRVCAHLLDCHTPALGQTRYQCNHCGHTRHFHPGCGDRHCPQCQQQATQAWIQKQQAMALPVPYHHLVFTLPQQLNGWAQLHPRELYNLLFQSVWKTLQTFGHNHKRLGGQMGMISVLHTWGQTLVQHIHLHCLVPAGALTSNGQWNVIQGDYLFPVRALSRHLRGSMVSGLRKAHQQNRLHRIHRSDEFRQTLDDLMQTEWVVHSRPCLHATDKVVAYLGRYTRRTAISDARLVAVTDQTVAFRYKDYRDNNQHKIMELPGEEFIRRFLLHILPPGFMRVRHYGYLANRCRKQKLAEIHQAMDRQPPEEPQPPTEPERLCPHCRIGLLRLIGRTPPPRKPQPKPGRRR